MIGDGRVESVVVCLEVLGMISDIVFFELCCAPRASWMDVAPINTHAALYMLVLDGRGFVFYL
jgi:hypothetical protein